MDKQQRSRYKLPNSSQVSGRPTKAVNSSGLDKNITKPKGDHKTISLELKVPKFKKPDLPYVKIRKFGLLAVAAVAVIIVASVVVSNLKPETKGSKAADTTIGGVPKPEFKPEFEPVVPLDKPDIAKTQSATSTYDPERKVLSYTDTYLGESFTISQQKLPEAFKNGTDALSKLADSLGQKQVLETHRGTGYLSTNPKTREQTVVLTTPELLLFIRSAEMVEESIWETYINKLNI